MSDSPSGPFYVCTMISISDNIKLSPAARRIRNVLDKKVEVTYRELEDTLGYSAKTCYRAIQELRDNDIPVEENGKPKRFSLPPELRRHDRRIVELNQEEILALRLAAQIAQSVLAPTPLKEPLQSAFSRLLVEMMDQSVSIDRSSPETQWHFSDAPASTIDDNIFNQLRQAIQEQQSVRIDYWSVGASEPKTRKVDPYCIAGRSGSWLLVAWCHERKSEREFNLADIRRITSCDPETDPEAYYELAEPFNPDDYFFHRFRFLGGGDSYVVKLLVEPRQTRYFRRKHYHPTQVIEQEDRPDGRIVVSYDVEGLDELRSFAQSWGTGVTVLEPEELRTIMREQAAEILERYERS